MFEIIQILEEQYPGSLLCVIQLSCATGFFPQNVVDVLESLLEHIFEPFRYATDIRHDLTSICGAEKQKAARLALDGLWACGTPQVDDRPIVSQLSVRRPYVA